jgi:hypothetical protein
MPFMRSKLIVAAVFLGLSASGLLYWQHTAQADLEQKRTDAARQQEHLRESEQNRQAALALTQKYNADAEWKRGLNTPKQRTNDSYSLEKREVASKYTIQLQRALINDAGRPITVIATVLDVIERDGRPYVVLEDARSPDIRFQLEITIEAASTFMKRPRSQTRFGKILQLEDSSVHEHYAVVANIVRVERRQISNNVLTPNPDLFLVTGRCVDFEFVGDYQGS